MLEKALNKQIKLAVWQVVITVGFFMGYGFIIGGTIDALKDASDSTEIRISNQGLVTTGMIFLFTTGISGIVLWILGIIGAININSLTSGRSTVLVVFSIITLFIGHLIAAISERNKYRSGNFVNLNNIPIQNNMMPTQDQNITEEKSNDDYEEKLKQAFMDGFISPDEYEKKLKEHRSK